MLIITFAFPPNAEVGAQRMARLCRYLPEHGVEPVVLTVREDCYQLRDDTQLPPAVSIHRTGVRHTLVSLYSGFAGGGAAAAAPGASVAGGDAVARRNGFGLRKRLLRALETPDAHRNWRAPAIRTGNRLLAGQRFDAILSSGPPWTAHWVGRSLQRRFRIPWLADFRDPWAPATRRDPRWRRAVQTAMESACVRDADCVICNTQALRDNFADRYPALDAGKFVTITNGFDDAESDGEAAAAPGAPRVLLHLGSLYAERRIDTFCRALEQLVQAGDPAAARLRVLLVGYADPGLSATARAAAPEATRRGMIEFRPVQPWSVARQLLSEADILLLFQGSHRLQVPAKFYEYLQTGKPMLAVAERGALTDLIENTDAGAWAEPSDPSAIAAALGQALSMRARPAAEAEGLWSGRFHYRALAGSLAEQIRAVANCASAGRPY